MYEERLEHLMSQAIGSPVVLRDLGYESVNLGVDELDPDLIPKLSGYRGNMVYATMYLLTTDATELVGYILRVPGTVAVLALGVIKDGRLVRLEVENHGIQ